MWSGGRQIKISWTFHENRANSKNFDASRSKIGPLADSQWSPELGTLHKKICYEFANCSPNFYLLVLPSTLTNVNQIWTGQCPVTCQHVFRIWTNSVHRMPSYSLFRKVGQKFSKIFATEISLFFRYSAKTFRLPEKILTALKRGDNSASDR